MVKYLWRLWAKSLGAKDGISDKESDRIAIIRTVLVLIGLFTGLVSFITNIVIMSGVWKHWND